MDLNDWLYILFIGIAVVSSLFSGSKKKRKQTHVPPAANKPQQQVRPQSSQIPTQKKEEQQSKPANTPSWMDILQQLEDKAKEPKQKPQPVVKPKPVVTKSQPQINRQMTSKSTLSDKKPRKQLESRISRKIENQMPIELEQETAGLDLDFRNISEIKKGIIYSEIFNRRY